MDRQNIRKKHKRNNYLKKSRKRRPAQVQAENARHEIESGLLPIAFRPTGRTDTPFPSETDDTATMTDSDSDNNIENGDRNGKSEKSGYFYI